MSTKKNIKGIFIHSLFKCGSTYIWHKFRQIKSNICFYEPLHPYLLNINKNYESEFTKEFRFNNSATSITPHLLKEYEPLIAEKAFGLPHLKKEFIFDSYCQTESIPGLEKYISAIEKCAKSKMPVLQFNRTSLRTKWFKNKFPEFLNIYVLRDPRDQFKSYLESYRHKSRIFNAMDLLIASKHMDFKVFELLSKSVELICYNDVNIENELKFYTDISEAYTDSEKYIIFFFIWFFALIENISEADFIIDINELSINDEYRKRIEGKLIDCGIKNINFSDAKIRIYENQFLKEKNVDQLEEQIKFNILQLLNLSQNEFLDKLAVEPFREHFEFSPKSHNNVYLKEQSNLTNISPKVNKIIQIIFKNCAYEREQKLVYMQKFNDCNKKYNKFKSIDEILRKIFFYKIIKICLLPIRIIFKKK